MQLSQDELLIIDNARKYASKLAVIRVSLLIVLASSIAFMQAAYIDVQAMAIIAVVSCVLALFLPRWIPGPKYEELVGLLVNKID